MPATKSAPKTSAKKVISGVEQIGATAGQVWHCLNGSGPASFTQLSKEIDAPKDLVMQAIGWLAREGKISIEENGRSRTVSLS
jgi:hypothetical protein